MNFDQLSLFEQLVPIVLPFLVTAVMKLFRRLPKWTIPAIVLPGLGVAAQWVASALEGGEASPLTGLMLAALALLIREVTNQLGKAASAMNDGTRVARVGDRPPDPTRPTL